MMRWTPISSKSNRGSVIAQRRATRAANKKNKKITGGTQVRIYRGVHIYPCELNSSGVRYYAAAPSGGGYLRSDTLAGIKQLIKFQRALNKIVSTQTV